MPSLGPVLGPNAAGSLKVPKDLNKLDFSVKKLQDSTKMNFSNYELTNKMKFQKILE